MNRDIFIQFIIVIFLCAGAAFAQTNRNLAPCAMLTGTDAGKILGVKVRLKEEGKVENEKFCYYTSADDRQGVNVIFRIYASRKEALGRFTAMCDLALGTCNRFRAVRKLGRRAWACRDSDYFSRLDILQNNVGFQISVTAEKYSKTRLDRIARRIAAKL